MLPQNEKEYGFNQTKLKNLHFEIFTRTREVAPYPKNKIFE